MAEPLSVASSVVALVAFALQSSAVLYKTVRSFQSQDKDARALKNELSDLVNVLESLMDTVTSNPGIDFDTLKLPLHRCGRACEEYGELIARCMKHSTGSRSSIRDWLKQRYLQGDINDFRTMLAGYKSTINIALANANIRVAAITPQVLEDYKDLITDTTADLQDHLRSLEQQVKNLSIKKINSESAEFDATEWHAMLEEKESTQLGLRLCAQLSAEIEEFESTSKEPPQFSDRPSAHKHLKSGLNTTKNSIESLMSRLLSHQANIDKQLEAMLAGTLVPEDATTQLAQLQETKASIRQCIQVVSDAGNSLSEERRNVFEDIALADHSYEFSVSTVGDLVTARRLILKGRSRHIGGQLSNQDYQKSIDALTHLDLEHIRATHSLSQGRADLIQSSEQEVSDKGMEYFHNRYGRGVKLTPSEGVPASQNLAHRRQDQGRNVNTGPGVNL
ncbi:hypothetical protein DL768_011029 [Monosporascus sp. mg162]|nr:hypothetical protein DL768_011029 [Monosporascus sp. mg162]